MHKSQLETELRTRLPPVDEEDEVGSESEDYSVAGSGDEDLYEGAQSDQSNTSFATSHSADAFAGDKGKGVDRGDVPRPPSRPRSSSVAKEKQSRTWADLEWSMVVALVSPVGNWLTGSDHVKNLFLLLLLIFYLHQLIEGQSGLYSPKKNVLIVFLVPWKLYNSSRPRSRKKLGEVVQDVRAEFASSELRAQELFLLTFTVISPFIGAILIRHIFSAMEGVDSLSWFSTTLFVLATGIRPWMHLVSRMQQRTDDLQEAMYAEEEEEYHRSLEQKLESAMNRLGALERALHDVRGKADKVAPLEEACDEIGEALETVERTVHRQERKTESARVSHNNRLAALESIVLRLEEQQKQHLRVVSAHAQVPKDSVNIALPPFLSQFFVRLRTLFSSMTFSIYNQYPFLTPSSSYTKPITTSISTSPPISPSGTVHFFNGTPLETILEAADSDSEGTYVSDKESTSHTSAGAGETRKRGARKLSRSRSRSRSGPRPALVRRRTYGRVALSYVSTMVAWPYEFAVKVFQFVVPAPVQKHFL